MTPPADHFSRVAPAYAAGRPGYPDELFDYLNVQVSRHDLAWDCAAGSGQAAIHLARRFRRVIATDISPAMLRQAPRHPAVEYRVAPAEDSGLREATADLVTVAQALHWLHTETFYAEAARVLVPGGVLAAWTYGVQYLDEPALDRILRRFYDVVGHTGLRSGAMWKRAIARSPSRSPKCSRRRLSCRRPGLWPSCWAMWEPGRPPRGSGRLWAMIPWMNSDATWDGTGGMIRRVGGSDGR